MKSFYCTFDELSREEVLELKRELEFQLQFERSPCMAAHLHDQITGLAERLRTFEARPGTAPKITTL